LKDKNKIRTKTEIKSNKKIQGRRIRITTIIRRMPSSGMWCPVDLVGTDISEERIASIFRLEKSAERRFTQDLHGATS
jgi:hypothetical protein